MNHIIGYLDNKTIGYLDCHVIDNIGMNNPIKYPDFSRRLTQIWKECAAAPVKQTQLAKWLGFAQPTVNNWINGNALPGLETAVILADRLGCNPIWLITGKGAKDTSEESQLTNHNGYLEQANLTPEQLQAVKLIIAQFEQTNPLKAENKSLTYPTENVGGGGVKEPSAAYDVKLPVQQAQAQDMREPEFSNSDSARYLALIKQSCIDHLCFCDKSPSRDLNYPLSYAAMIQGLT